MAEQHWSRPYHTPTRARALVHFVVFGSKAADEIAASASRHHIGNLPPEYDVIMVERGRRGFVDPRELIPAALQRDRRLMGAAVACDFQIAVRAELADKPDLLELRSLIGLTMAVAEAASARAVLDLQIFALRSADHWAAEVFVPDAPHVDSQLLVMRSNEPNGIWLHTRGLRKFARPDLSMRGLAESELGLATEIVLRFAHYQTLGGVVEDGTEVRVAGWPAGWTCRHAGQLDDPDFNNVHLKIEPPSGAQCE